MRNLLWLLVALASAAPAGAQQEISLDARARVFPDVGPGLRALARDAHGHYFVLVAPAPAVAVYNTEGQLVKRVPPSPGGQGSVAASPALAYGVGLDVDAAGRIYVADREANAVKVFSPEGALVLTIPVAAPSSVAALPEGEIAVASMKSARLVSVFDVQGHLVREFGDPTEIAERSELNRFLNIGRLCSDPAGHIYYAFAYLPEPTLRKYDRYGYAAFEIAATTLDFQPAAQAARREIRRLEHGGTPSLKPVITAMGVDPETEEIWVAVGGLLLHFDREGTRRGTYRTFTPEGARLEAVAILIEPHRLLLVSDPLGIYDFPRPDRKPR
jgi:hypothetical protein